VERVQIAGRNIPRMNRRPGKTAGPRSRSSMLVGLDSSRTLLILLFHGVKREITGPPPGRASDGQTLDGLDRVSSAEWVRSAE
jgi:hypothetical protein